MEKEGPFPWPADQDAVYEHGSGCGHAQRGSPQAWPFSTRPHLQQSRPLSSTQLRSYSVGSSFLLVLPELNSLVMVVLFRSLPIAIF